MLRGTFQALAERPLSGSSLGEASSFLLESLSLRGLSRNKRALQDLVHAETRRARRVEAHSWDTTLVMGHF